MADEEQNPVDQLIDLFVYAPVGLLYEYQEVLPKLVKRGKSQVQLARIVGKMATNRGGGTEALNLVAGGLASAITKQITEFGEAIGLAPPSEDAEPPPAQTPPAATPPPPTPESQPVEVTATAVADPGTDADHEDPEPVLPIARYDELTAKEIIGLLDDLEPNQLDRVRAHEEANRARKTVFGKLDRLGH